MRYLLPLSAVDLDDTGQIGRKAAVLGALRGQGFPVPDGFAVTTEAVRAPAEELRAELAEALRELGDPPVAVRSSGVAEDLADQSYAGQYESVLDVRGPAAVLDAVRHCWASADSARLAVYHRGEGAPPPIGVLVQRMVPAVAAGAAFSANPVTGDTGEVLISAVRGLGEQLMAGAVTAEEWVVRGDTAERTSGDQDALTAVQAKEIAALARRVAEHFGVPQDIEWAIADGEPALVQARPITALPEQVEQIPVDAAPPPGFWVRDRNSDRPWTAMQRSVFLPVFAEVSRHVFAFTTGARPAVAQIGGWLYLSLPPDTPAERAQRLAHIAARIAAGEPLALVRRWQQEWKPAFAQRIAALRETDLTALSDVDFAAHFRRIAEFFGELHEVYFRLSGASIALLGELGLTCRELLDWTPEQTLRLRGGLTGDHMPAAVRLGELAALAAGHQDPTGGPAFAAAFAEYVRDYGHRTVGFDITEPTMAEQPGMLLNLVRAQLDSPYDFDREQRALAQRQQAALTEARAALAPADREKFESAFAGSEAAGPVRDEKVFYAVSLWAQFRYATQELGRRLAARDQLADPGDAFHLDLEPALTALAQGGDVREPARLGRGQHAWALAHPGPKFHGDYQPPDSGDLTLSPAAQRVAEAGQWSMSLWGGGPAGEAEDGSLRGIAASAGRYTGPVRVITSVTEFGKLRSGDVLVCPETTAQWAVLFPSIGALVTDNGSLLSHPAILAREYGIPAVVATGNATGALRDGLLVTVDGAAGLVRPAG
ncbi:PEP-utilizing enzyme [Crossiella sp. SN42]|uniref:PEP/pyruvate-binding domain-containing protein n=1 Tax=Crossiella sp. SN42 TaxID=2944808 RepID=UPI00207D1888|nr:PEP/pyruvate-binding domain-containing protein [Crossiella sp. SN42]MCO1580338.1 PEP-utilizing enzyme [Crossiella sp. SN42]